MPQPGLTRREFCARSLGATAAGLALPAWLTADAASPDAANPDPTPPQRRWELFVIQHSHIDLGYTDRQEVIADYHRQFVRQAIDYALSEKQATRPPEARFKYTIEGFWSLEQFLRSASKKERRNLGRALKSGLIELTAGYFHLTELLDQEVLRSTLQPGQRFARHAGLHLDTCMSCDVNGFSWGFCELLAEAGVRYLSTNINTHHGGVPLGKPLVPFHWESPSGRRILVWSGLAYHRANVLGLMGYFAPDTNLGFPGFDLPPKHRYEAIHDIRFAESKLLPTLAHLERSGYPYDFLPLMGNAVYTDNGPAGDQYCELITEWNRRHGERVHIRTATLAEFFRHLERSTPDIPTYRGEWTDWWSDGVAATPLDTLVYRHAQRTRHLVRRLDPDHQAVSAARIEAIDRKLALYAEHTFGYSHTAAHSLLTHQVFGRKSLTAMQADELAGQALVDALRRRGEGEFTARRPFTYRVINPHAQPVRAAVALPVDYWEQSWLSGGVRVIGPRGTILPSQIEPAPRGRSVLTRVELAAHGEIEVRLEAASEPVPAPGPAREFANPYYRVSWETPRGLYSMIDQTSGQELLGASSGGLGTPVYQIFPGGNRGAAAGFGYSARTIPRDEITPGQCTRIRRLTSGQVCERWELLYEVPGALDYVLQATFHHHLPYLELTARMVKTEVTDPEGLYVSFPFSLQPATWYLDKPGAPIRPGIDQLPGACCDYYCLQSGAALVGPKSGLAWTTLDAPLVHLDQPKLWKYSTTIDPRGPLFSWLTNNKWETNFRLTCGGRFEFRYLLQASADLNDPQRALEVCRINAMPPVVLRL